MSGVLTRENGVELVYTVDQTHPDLLKILDEGAGAEVRRADSVVTEVTNIAQGGVARTIHSKSNMKLHRYYHFVKTGHFIEIDVAEEACFITATVRLRHEGERFERPEWLEKCIGMHHYQVDVDGSLTAASVPAPELKRIEEVVQEARQEVIRSLPGGLSPTELSLTLVRLRADNERLMDSHRIRDRRLAQKFLKSIKRLDATGKKVVDHYGNPLTGTYYELRVAINPGNSFSRILGSDYSVYRWSEVPDCEDLLLEVLGEPA